MLNHLLHSVNFLLIRTTPPSSKYYFPVLLLLALTEVKSSVNSSDLRLLQKEHHCLKSLPFHTTIPKLFTTKFSISTTKVTWDSFSQSRRQWWLPCSYWILKLLSPALRRESKWACPRNITEVLLSYQLLGRFGGGGREGRKQPFLRVHTISLLSPVNTDLAQNINLRTISLSPKLCLHWLWLTTEPMERRGDKVESYTELRYQKNTDH